MAPNSRIVKYLTTMYRNVLRQQWVARREAYVAAIRHAVGPWPRAQMETLEPRILLSTVKLTDITVASYTGTPFIVAGMETVLKNGINALADQINTLSTNGDFSTD